MMRTTAGRHPTLFFDGECNLCNSAVQFVIRRDRKKTFRFAPLQSGPGKNALRHISPDGVAPDSFILLANGQYYIRSSAALHALRMLGGAWPLLFVLGMAIPRFVRDPVYDFVSRNRYKWFGKRKACMIPAPDLLDRFISS